MTALKSIIMLPLYNFILEGQWLKYICCSSERLTAGLSAPRGLGEDAADGVEDARRPAGGGGAHYQLPQVPEAAAGRHHPGRGATRPLRGSD